MQLSQHTYTFFVHLVTIVYWVDHFQIIHANILGGVQCLLRSVVMISLLLCYRGLTG